MKHLADISFRAANTLCGIANSSPAFDVVALAKDVDCERCLRAVAEIRSMDPPLVSVARLREILLTVMPDLRDFAGLTMTKFHKVHLDCTSAMTWDQRFDRLMRHASPQDVVAAMQHHRRFMTLLETHVSAQETKP